MAELFKLEAFRAVGGTRRIAPGNLWVPLPLLLSELFEVAGLLRLPPALVLVIRLRR